MKRLLPINTDGKSIARSGGSLERVSCWRGEIILISMAAGLVWVKQGGKMSARWELKLGMREGTC